MINIRDTVNHISYKGKTLYPSKIVCIGRNYAKHIQELNNELPDKPVIFIKPNSAISHEILIPKDSLLHYETELCLLMCDNEHIGVGVGLDLTNRARQSQLKAKGLPWEEAKAFDHSAVFTDFFEIKRQQIELLRFELWINDALVQSGDCKQMIYKPMLLLDYVNKIFTLVKGDILMTGTPSGVGEVKENDHYRMQLYVKEQLCIDRNFQVKRKN